VLTLRPQGEAECQAALEQGRRDLALVRRQVRCLRASLAAKADFAQSIVYSLYAGKTQRHIMELGPEEP
jgi:hypothetical protein